VVYTHLGVAWFATQMMYKSKMIKKGQAIMEFVIAFIIVATLIMVLINLWRWSEGQIPNRQGAFEGSRVSAGKIENPGFKGDPVYSAPTPGEPGYL